MTINENQYQVGRHFLLEYGLSSKYANVSWYSKALGFTETLISSRLRREVIITLRRKQAKAKSPQIFILQQAYGCYNDRSS